MNADKLREALNAHGIWLASSGAKGVRADLYGADLSGADLSRANLPHFQIPEGDLVGWKSCGTALVRLLIPARARRTGSLVGRKCRAEFAVVTWIERELTSVRSDRGGRYDLGCEVWPDKYDDDPRVECTHGVHFFLTRKEAEEWRD